MQTYSFTPTLGGFNPQICNASAQVLCDFSKRILHEIEGFKKLAIHSRIHFTMKFDGFIDVALCLFDCGNSRKDIHHPSRRYQVMKRDRLQRVLETGWGGRIVMSLCRCNLVDVLATSEDLSPHVDQPVVGTSNKCGNGLGKLQISLPLSGADDFQRSFPVRSRLLPGKPRRAKNSCDRSYSLQPSGKALMCLDPAQYRPHALPPRLHCRGSYPTSTGVSA